MTSPLFPTFIALLVASLPPCYSGADFFTVVVLPDTQYKLGDVNLVRSPEIRGTAFYFRIAKKRYKKLLFGTMSLEGLNI